VKRLFLISTLALVASIATLVSCKQGEGERCQIDDDCESPLVCNMAKNTCQGSGRADFDAGTIDMVPSDVATDAAPDTMPDTP
jgi:hypothetical protein